MDFITIINYLLSGTAFACLTLLFGALLYSAYHVIIDYKKQVEKGQEELAKAKYDIKISEEEIGKLEKTVDYLDETLSTLQDKVCNSNKKELKIETVMNLCASAGYTEEKDGVLRRAPINFMLDLYIELSVIHGHIEVWYSDHYWYLLSDDKVLYKKAKNKIGIVESSPIWFMRDAIKSGLIEKGEVISHSRLLRSISGNKTENA